MNNELPSCSPDDPRLLGLRQLIGVMDQLRDPGGCPWDRAQDRGTLRPFLLEETFELLEALDEGEAKAIREELGDVLFQVVFHARLAQEEDAYHLGDVAADIACKLFRRHPHVFQRDRELDDPQAVVAEWEEHKRREGRRSLMDGIPRQLPALLRAQKIQEKAGRVGFDWENASGPLSKLEEEIGEVKEAVEAGQVAQVRSELGDLLLSVVNLARHHEASAEGALREACVRFERRFRHMERVGGDLKPLSLDEKEALWEQAKLAERESD